MKPYQKKKTYILLVIYNLHLNALIDFLAETERLHMFVFIYKPH